ncbi:putative mitochondrial protein AtMg01250 [Bidens hawaiensis]|uniref:putative mitochondrial protein AtMg01250 n=1 Tax=Bidens hawaiensis TaxID=980011 RepID=UPI00404ABA68
MSNMGFAILWRNWIYGVVSSARPSILVNGSITFEFSYSRGIRQGDAISPFLFIMAMEALMVIFKNGCNNGVFQDFQMPNEGPLLFHLSFVDDALIVGEWSVSNV